MQKTAIYSCFPKNSAKYPQKINQPINQKNPKKQQQPTKQTKSHKRKHTLCQTMTLVVALSVLWKMPSIRLNIIF